MPAIPGVSGQFSIYTVAFPTLVDIGLIFGCEWSLKARIHVRQVFVEFASNFVRPRFALIEERCL